MRLSWLFVRSCALICALPAFAQAPGDKDTASDQSRDIVVTGQAQTPADVRKQAGAITQNVGEKYKVPLAQFQEPVCPGIVGMPASIAEVMIARIRSNAEVVGIPVAREGKCEANILVFFVVNGQQTIRELQNRRSDLFRSISTHDLTKLASELGPVHAWVNTITRSRHGDELRGDETELGNPPTLYVANSHSHMWLASRIDIASSVVMLDMKAVVGMSAVQLADYATMRTFAQTRPAIGGTKVGTILSLFDEGSAKPMEMTDFDIAYLRAIYHSASNINAVSKLGHIDGELRKQRAQREAEE
jgi:hypothetical protein